MFVHWYTDKLCRVVLASACRCRSIKTIIILDTGTTYKSCSYHECSFPSQVTGFKPVLLKKIFCHPSLKRSVKFLRNGDLGVVHYSWWDVSTTLLSVLFRWSRFSCYCIYFLYKIGPALFWNMSVWLVSVFLIYFFVFSSSI